MRRVWKYSSEYLAADEPHGDRLLHQLQPVLQLPREVLDLLAEPPTAWQLVELVKWLDDLAAWRLGDEHGDLTTWRAGEMAPWDLAL